jgi:hypothetical protein
MALKKKGGRFGRVFIWFERKVMLRQMARCESEAQDMIKM